MLASKPWHLQPAKRKVKKVVLKVGAECGPKPKEAKAKGAKEKEHVYVAAKVKDRDGGRVVMVGVWCWRLGRRVVGAESWGGELGWRWGGRRADGVWVGRMTSLLRKRLGSATPVGTTPPSPRTWT